MRVVYSSVFICLVVLYACKTANNDDYELQTPLFQKKSPKRGVSFSFHTEEDISILGSAISWSYNWGTSQNADLDEAMDVQNIDFCPMAWNEINEKSLRKYILRNPKCEYLLAFNEPNLIGQANMTPRQAADKWSRIKSIADEMQLKVISPAMNYGTLEGYSDPIDWLDEFFSLVPISDVEGIAVHCYMAQAPSLKSYIERFKKYNKPIWLTEFCAWEDYVSAEVQKRFLSDAVNYLESDPDIFRYAWFIPRGSGSENDFPYMFLLKNKNKAELTELGIIFTQISSQDKSIYYVEQQQIEAEHYSDICISESVGRSGWAKGPLLRQTSDAPSETLELYNFISGQWVEYQIEPNRSKSFCLEIRYASTIDTDLEISVDGLVLENIKLENTSEYYIWKTARIPLNLIAGKQTLRLTINNGKVCINWLRFV